MSPPGPQQWGYRVGSSSPPHLPSPLWQAAANHLGPEVWDPPTIFWKKNVLKNLGVNGPQSRTWGSPFKHDALHNLPNSCDRRPPLPLESSNDFHYLKLGQVRSVFWMSKGSTHPKTNKRDSWGWFAFCWTASLLIAAWITSWGLSIKQSSKTIHMHVVIALTI